MPLVLPIVDYNPFRFRKPERWIMLSTDLQPLHQHVLRYVFFDVNVIGAVFSREPS